MKIEKKFLNVGANPMGAGLDILKYEIDSEREGKTLYIQSGTHGGEITQWILHELFSYLKNNLIKGKVVVIPCSNPVSWTQRTYFSTNGKFDFYMGKDWNRNFPGNENGTLGERIAHVLMTEAKKSDFAFDLHTSRKSIPFAIFSRQEYERFIKIIGIEYNQFIDMDNNSGYKNTMNSSLDSLGIPNICIECGSHDAYEPLNVVNAVLGIKRILKHFDMISGDDISDNEATVKVFTKTVTYRALKGALIRIAKSLGDKILQGDELYYYYDNNDLGNATAHRAVHNGVLFKLSPTNIYWSGDDVLQLLTNDGIKEI